MIETTSSFTENETLLRVLRHVGRGDLSVGRLYEGHVNALQLIRLYGSAAQKSALEDNLATGKLYGVWATERSPGVKLKNEGNKTSLTGAKVFASGAGNLDFVIITAQSDQGDAQLVIVPANDSARADTSGWRVRGMKATQSGRYSFDGLDISVQQLLGTPGEYTTEPAFSAGAWRFAAVQLGGIEALLKEIRQVLPKASDSDVLQRLKFIDAVIAGRTAFLWVREAGKRAAVNDPSGPAFAGVTRSIVEMAGLQVMDLAARIAGTRSAFYGERIDKVTRDLSLYLRQASPDQVKDRAAMAWLDQDAWSDGDELW